MKRAGLLLPAMLFAAIVLLTTETAQAATGDFSTRQTGNWSDATTWIKSLTGTASFVNGTTPGFGTRTLLAFLDAEAKQAAKVAANGVSNWRQSANSADMVIISSGDFSPSLQPLKSLREGQGLKTVIVDIDDVYDEFSFGQKTPTALKDFLSYARFNWKKAPKYVLLGGMASFDPRSYFAFGNTDLIPTKIVQTEHLETASDDWFADFNDDGSRRWRWAACRLATRKKQQE